jgi:hypothetical protein
VAVIFPRWTNRLPLLLAGIAPIVLGLVVTGVWYYLSPNFTDVGYRPQQPIAFSHKVHAGELGMDCRYCHNTVERGARAAIPPTATCMNCHAYVKTGSDEIKKIWASAENNTPIEWVRVHLLPDYAYFDHSVHLAAGIGCVSCHGRIDRMDVVQQDQPLSMGWCLDCHRNPSSHLRPRAEVTNMDYDPVAAGYVAGSDEERARRDFKLAPPEHCSGCHR